MYVAVAWSGALNRTKAGRGWWCNVRTHRKALKQQGEPFDIDATYVRGGLTNFLHVFLRAGHAQMTVSPRP